MRTSYVIAVIIALLAFVWIISGAFVDSAPEKETKTEDIRQEEDAPLAKVRVKDVQVEDHTSTIIVTGRSLASKDVTLSAEINAQVKKIHYREGMVVDKDAVLAELNIADREKRLKEAQSLVEQKEIEYNAAVSLENKGFNSKVRLAQTIAELDAAKANLRQAQENYDYTKIRAPFQGVIQGRFVEVGDYATSGTALFRLVVLDPLEIRVYLTEHDVTHIENGQSVTASFLTGVKREGEIISIAPAADEQTRTFEVKITVPNPDHKILAGMTAEVTIPTTIQPAIRISPSILSLNDSGEVGVKIVNNQDVVEFKPVEILSDETSHMWVGGIKENTRVITVGKDFVAEGQKVEVKTSETDGLL